MKHKNDFLNELAVAGREARLAELEARYVESLARIASLEKSLGEAHGAIVEAARIQTTRSWQWTRPLRWMVEGGRHHFDRLCALRTGLSQDQPACEAATPEPRPPETALPPLQPSAYWARYEETSRRLSRPNQGRDLWVPPLELIRIPEAQTASAVKELSFSVWEHPEISIIIPVFNQLVFTLECLFSLQEFLPEDLPVEILVADGGSTDGTAESLGGVPGLRLLRREEQTDFLDNCNGAAAEASGTFLLFLNNDAQITAGAVESMRDTFRHYADAGAVGPKILYPSGYLQEAGGRIRADGSAEMIGLNEDPELPKYNFLRKVDYCSGACLMVPSALFRQVGGFSEEFRPAYGEDLDLCLKLRAAGREVYYQPQAVVAHHLSQSYNAGANTQKLRLCRRHQIRLRDKWAGVLDADPEVRLIAFYLPQFHAIPENDIWWGRGFTEWTNVSSATPVFEGHVQPRLPGELGFYDLRLPEVLARQAELARRFGVHGFCFYYYWFHGKRLLETPLERMLASGTPDMPFCICWANENWTRRWDGQDQDILMSQAHSPEDDEAVMLDMLRYLRDPRYIRVDGKPLLLIYRPALFPDIARTAAHWRELCRSRGLGEILLASVDSMESDLTLPPERYGFDFSANFPPHGTPYRNSCPDLVLRREALIYRYRDLIEHHTGVRADYLRRFLGVCPGWDNTPRRKTGSSVFADGTPGEYQAWLEWAILETRRLHRNGERLVFINAWNEWGEGAVLEPDQFHGTAYLEATRNALFNTRGS